LPLLKFQPSYFAKAEGSLEALKVYQWVMLGRVHWLWTMNVHSHRS